MISAVSRLYLGYISRRYEVNIDYVPKLEAKGLQFVGRDTTGERMEVCPPRDCICDSICDSMRA